MSKVDSSSSGSYGLNLQTLGCQPMRIDQWSAVFGQGGCKPKNNDDVDDDDGIYDEEEEEATFWFVPNGCIPVQNEEDKANYPPCNPTACRMSSGVCVDCTRCVMHCNCTPLSSSQAKVVREESTLSGSPLRDLQDRAVYLIRDSSLLGQCQPDSTVPRDRSLEREEPVRLLVREDRGRSLEREGRRRSFEYEERSHRKERRPPRYQDLRQSNSYEERGRRRPRRSRRNPPSSQSLESFPLSDQSNQQMQRDRSLTTKQGLKGSNPAVRKQLDAFLEGTQQRRTDDSQRNKNRLAKF